MTWNENWTLVKYLFLFPSLHQLLFPFLFYVSDAQIPDALRPVYTDLETAEAFWISYYRGIPGYEFVEKFIKPNVVFSSAAPPPLRTTRHSGETTPWHIPSGTDWNYTKGKMHRSV